MIKTKPVKMDDARYLGKSPGSISFSNLALHRHYKKEFTSVFSCDQMPPLSSGSVMLGILCILKQKKRQETKQKHPNDQSFYRALLDASNALNPEGYDYLHYLILSGWQLVKSVALPANAVVHAKISGELFDFICVHSLEHVSTQVSRM